MLISYNDYVGGWEDTDNPAQDKYQHRIRESEFPHILDTGNLSFKEAMGKVADVLKYNHICGKFKDNYRKIANFEYADCLELDCDNDTDNEAAWVTPELLCSNPLFAECAFWTSTSRNHMKVKHPGTDKEKSARPRFHVGMPLSRPVVDTELKQIKKALLYTDQGETLVRPETFFFDRGAKDIAHLIYGVEGSTVQYQDGEYIDIIMCKQGLLCVNGNTGQYEAVLSDTSYNTASRANKPMVSANMVNQSDLPSNTQNKATNKVYPKYSLAQLQVMFKCIAKVPNLEYNDWLHMAMALKSGGYDFSLFNDLSRMIPGYVSPEDCQRKWDSVTAEGGIGMGTLIRLAQQGGFKPLEVIFSTDGNVVAPLSGDFPPFPTNRSDMGIASLIERWAGQYEQQEDGSYDRVGSRLLWLIKDETQPQRGRFVKFDGTAFVSAVKNPIQACMEKLASRQREWLDTNPVDNPKLADKLRSFTTQNMESAKGVKAVEYLIKGKITHFETMMDTQTSVLNCKGQLVDLTGKTEDGKIKSRALQPCDYITKSTLAKPSHKNREFVEQMLSEILVKEDGKTPDPKLIEYFQRIVGCALLCNNPNRVVYFCTAKSKDKSEEGNGSNGKSTLFNAIKVALGDYAVTIEQTLLTKSKSDNKRFSYIDLLGERLALLNEAPDGRLDADSLKKLAPSAGEQIRADIKNVPGISFDATHTVFVLTNNQQSVREMDTGTWRRIVVIPFNAHFEPTKEGNEKVQRLASPECAGALVEWAIEGALWVYENNYIIPMPESVQEATRNYKLEQNEILTFLEENDLETCEYSINEATGRPKNDASVRIEWEQANENGCKQAMGILNLYCAWAGVKLDKYIRETFLQRLQACYKPAMRDRSHNVYYVYGIRRRPLEAKDIGDTHD